MQVRTGFSEWQGDRYRRATPRAAMRTCAERLCRSRYGLWLAGACLALLILAPIWLLRPAAAPHAAELPNVLEERVPIWIDAWFLDDVPRLLRLTVPSCDRQLRGWMLHHPSPSRYDRDDPPKSEVWLTSVKPHGNHSAEVTAEVRIVGSSGRPQRLLVRQTWNRIAETWYFVPPSPATRPRR